MSQGKGNILLYGATGFSGGLIVAEGKAGGMTRSGNECRLTLAASDGAGLRQLAKDNEMDFCVFRLDSRKEILKQLDGVGVVINAAGPFAATAKALATAALEADCHYVDINSEIDVYRNIDDLAPKAEQRGIAMVSGAGSSAAASDVLLDLALSKLGADQPLGAVRIAVSQSLNITRGSAAAIARVLREQVAVVRFDPTAKSAKLEDQMRVSHEPVGKLERTFDFGPEPEDSKSAKDTKGGPPKRGLRIASAVNMIDTLTAKHTLVRRKRTADTVESYVEMGSLGRIAYQASAMLSPFMSLPLSRAFTSAQLWLLPDRLTKPELEQDRQVVVLEIEDRLRRRLVDWRLSAPNAYQFTAQLALATARKLTTSKLKGWLTPAEALEPAISARDKSLVGDAYRGCDALEERQSRPLL